MGRVATYRAVAHAMGTRAYRAVGQALRANPYAPRVPCHRVIASDLSLGGFQGARSGSRLQQKAVLLRREGVVFRKGCLADRLRLYDFPKHKG
jgi:methylated-DNA-[protein]-cysteine S-methyltransferase